MTRRWDQYRAVGVRQVNIYKWRFKKVSIVGDYGVTHEASIVEIVECVALRSDVHCPSEKVKVEKHRKQNWNKTG